MLKDEGKPEMGLGTRIAEKFRGIGLKKLIQELRGYTLERIKFDQ